MYSLYDFLEKLKSDFFVIETNGHEYYTSIKEELIRKIENVIITRSTESPNETPEYKNYRLEQYAAMGESNHVIIGELPIFSIDFKCCTCGTRLRPILKNENTIMLEGWDVVSNKLVVVTDECIFKNGIMPHVTQINIPTGNLKFANYFDKRFKDAPEGNEYTQKWSLNFPIGRRNIADNLALSNVGYAQTGNMSIYVWKHKEKDEIVITEYDTDYFDEYEKYKKIIKKFKDLEKNYTFLGNISCGVWRWMCTDECNLEGFEELQHSDYINVQVSPGKWQIENYYDSDKYDNFHMAIFKKIN